MPIEIASEKALGDRASVQSQARKRPGRRKDVIVKRIGLKVVTYIGLTTVALIVIIPFILMLTTSLKTVAESSTYPPSLLPAVPQWHNYSDVFQAVPLLTYLFNTILY